MAKGVHLMGMLTHILAQSCDIVTITRNKYGDEVFASAATIACRFREITQFDRLGNRQELNSDAMLWVEPSADVEHGTIIRFDGEYYQVEEIVKARRLAGNAVYFKKCLLQKYANMPDAS